MRTFAAILTAISLCAPAIAQDLTDEKNKQSYAVGVQLGNAVKPGKDILDFDVVLNGLMDVLEGKELKLEQQEVMAAFREWQMAAQEAQQQVMSAEGENFLAENAKREGVTVLPSGLQYEVITEGTGASPTAEDTIKAHYRGTLIDGTQFDSSYDRGEPFEARVTGVIPGWTEALQLMKEGAKWKLYIPHNLAYGARGAGAQIPPYSTLIFEMELLEVLEN